jgi:Arc/MetJ-type ribon-helix-helix transcriptional regulator
MNVEIDRRGERVIEQQIRAGRYRSAEEVVARALETLPNVEGADAERRDTVREMLEFAAQHNFTLGEGVRAGDLVREGRKH